MNTRRSTPQPRLSWRQRLIGGLVSGILLGTGGCAPAAVGANQTQEGHALDAHTTLASETLRSREFDLHVRSVGTAKALQLLWIHGTPGKWSDIAGLMDDDEFLEHGRLISIDRPGWGLSQHRHQPRMAGTFEEHSVLLRPLLEHLHNAHPEVPLIVAGHSWGSPMAAYLGARHPQLIDGVVALAGPFDPSIGILRWYNHFGRLPGIRALIGSTLRRSNTEMFLLPGEVEAAQPVWRTLQRPLVIIHGEEDALVPIAHADYAARLFAETRTHVLKLENQGHLLQYEQPKLIGRCARALARQQMSACTER